MSIYTTPTYRAYVRLLLKGERKHIDKVIMDVKRFQGDEAQQDLRDALNAEKASMKLSANASGVAL